MSYLLKRFAATPLFLAAAVVAAPLFAAPPAEAAPPPPAKPTVFLPIEKEPPPTLRVDPPLAEPLATRGTVILPYRVENLRILPIFGPAATEVSPRAGHLHVTVNNLPWHWADAGNTDAVVVAGLPAGPHSVLIELATPEHRVIAGQRVHFVVPATGSGHGGSAARSGGDPRKGAGR